MRFCELFLVRAKKNCWFFVSKNEDTVGLCFGDSNTWGYDPAKKTRFLKNIRWTGVLQNLLCNNFNIIEEVLN